MRPFFLPRSFSLLVAPAPTAPAAAPIESLGTDVAIALPGDRRRHHAFTRMTGGARPQLTRGQTIAPWCGPIGLKHVPIPRKQRPDKSDFPSMPRTLRRWPSAPSNFLWYAFTDGNMCGAGLRRPHHPLCPEPRPNAANSTIGLQTVNPAIGGRLGLRVSKDIHHPLPAAAD